MKFDFSKSNYSDLQNKLQSNLDILMGNVLYLTHETDKIHKIVLEIKNNLKLQKQVDDYFDENDKDGTGEPHLGSDPDSED